MHTCERNQLIRIQLVDLVYWNVTGIYVVLVFFNWISLKQRHQRRWKGDQIHNLIEIDSDRFTHKRTKWNKT